MNDRLQVILYKVSPNFKGEGCRCIGLAVDIRLEQGADSDYSMNELCEEAAKRIGGNHQGPAVAKAIYRELESMWGDGD